MNVIPQTLESLFDERLRWLKTRNYSIHTIEREEIAFVKFTKWAKLRSIETPQAVTPSMLAAFQRWLPHQRTQQGNLFSVVYQHQILGAVSRAFAWAHNQGFLLSDPSGAMEMPRLPIPLPKKVMTTDQLEQLMRQPNPETLVGFRDRAFLELAYATAARRKELLSLHPEDLDRERQTMWIRKAKASRDRVVPVSERALKWVSKYELEVRELWLQRNPLCEFLFMSMRGNGWSESACNEAIGKYMQEVLPEQGGNVHAIRHAVATILLDSGADLRHLQELLGHQQISTTQIYTHIGIAGLQNMYQRLHPSATELVQSNNPY